MFAPNIVCASFNNSPALEEEFMRRKRELIEGAFYHVTSRTNNKICVFDRKIGRKIMLLSLRDAKQKYQFSLANFCIMPTHIHLLIRPKEGTCLSRIIQEIKTRSAKWWNFVHGGIDHMWGERFYSRVIRNRQEYQHVMNYIDQNPVAAGFTLSPAEWSGSGAFYKVHNIPDLVDCFPHERLNYIKLLEPPKR